MINLADWVNMPEDQPIVLTGENILAFCDVLDRLARRPWATSAEPDAAHVARMAKLRTAHQLTGTMKGDFGPHFGRMWTAEYAA